MKRRDFLASSIAAAGMISLRHVFGNNETAMREMVEPMNFKKEVLQLLENDFLKVTINSDASMEVFDKKRQQAWQSGPVAMQEEGPIDRGYVFNRTDRSICEQYPGRFAGTKEGDNIRFMLIGRQNEKMGEFVVGYHLEKDEMVVRIIKIDENIPSLFFPPPLFSESIILPERTGRIYREAGSYWTRTIYKLHQHISMRWFGGLHGQNGWMCILEDGWADSVLMKMCLVVQAGWLKSLGKWTPRSIRYCFTENGYVGQAKRFRKWAKAHDLFHSLKDKAKDLPQMNNIIGGRIVGLFMAYAKSERYDHENNLMPITDELKQKLGKVKVYNTFKDAKEIQQLYKDSGMKKGIFNYQGWMNGGYDYSHPDVWPPEKTLGTIDDFKNLLDVQEENIVSSVHDNYLDIYEDNPSFPGGVIVRPNGRYMTGGIWSARQCYILNSRNSLDYLKRNWKHLKTLGLKSMYIDTLTTMELYQSFEKGNTQTREQDFNQRQKIVKFLYENGIAMGSENISEITVMYGAYGNIHDYSRVQGENIPLFQLVFGDSCLINTGMKRTEKNKAWFNRHLNRIANGSFMTHGCWMKKWDKSMLEPFKNSFHVDEWHGKIATSELVNHRFLDDEYMVEELEYANGHKAVVNFGDNNFSFEGKTVKGNDYITT